MKTDIRTGTVLDFAATAPWPYLTQRAAILAKMRCFFTEHGFLEVETPLLSRESVVDRFIDPLRSGERFLQTSPELAMKRLLASEMPSEVCGIWQCCKAFRREECGRLHNPEFTIVEWYHRDHDMAMGVRFLSDLAEELLGCGPAEVVTYADMFPWGIDPHCASVSELRMLADHLGMEYPNGYDIYGDGEDEAAVRDRWLDLIITWQLKFPLCCEYREEAPPVGGRPIIVTEYPASQAALAQTKLDKKGRLVAERFELFAGGVELANGYHELCDAAELRRRFCRNNSLRLADGAAGGGISIPERLLAAMESGMPVTTGCALGFDRTVMLAIDRANHLYNDDSRNSLTHCRIDDVIPFPWDRA